jgi:RHS repeat-associated protein
VGQIAFGTGGSSRMTTIKQYDYLNRLTWVASTPSGTGLQPVANTYTYNLANQRMGNTFTDGSHWEYQYDSLGQVTNATRYWVDGTLVAGQQYAFAFDTIGNRLSSRAGGNTSGTGLRAATYAPNNLNEYSTRSSTTPWEADILGDALSGSTVTVNSSTPDSQHGQYFWKALAGSTTTPDWLGVSIVDGSTTVSGNVYLPPETETYHYDLDGNLTNDARWFYFWDAENRLVRMDTLASTAAAGIPAKSVRYSYDYQGRMISRTVFSGTYGSGSITWATSADTTATANVLFLYDGFQCVAELNADQSVYQTYVWGLDLSGSLSGAGGVGGLLMFQQTGTGTDAGTYFPTYDGNGNMTGLVKGSDGTVAATYEYGPFGNVLRMSGGLVAADNPFRFSSKWQDYQSDLLYYGDRYYSADTGRWLNRDPLGENGAENVYAFAGNNSVSRFDPNGDIGLDTALDLLVLGVDLSTGAGHAAIALDVASLAVSAQPTPIPLGVNPRAITFITRLLKGQKKTFELVDHALLRDVAEEPGFKGIVWNDVASRPQKASIVLEYQGRTPNDVGNVYDKHFKSFAQTENQAAFKSLGVSQFAPGVGDEQVRVMINEALRKQRAEFSQTFLSQVDGYVYEAGLPFGKPNTMRCRVGYAKGLPTTRIKLHVNQQGIIHAFPTLDDPTIGGSIVPHSSSNDD